MAAAGPPYNSAMPRAELKFETSQRPRDSGRSNRDQTKKNVRGAPIASKFNRAMVSSAWRVFLNDRKPEIIPGIIQRQTKGMSKSVSFRVMGFSAAPRTLVLSRRSGWSSDALALANSVIHRNWVELLRTRSFAGTKAITLSKSTYEFAGFSSCPSLFTGRKINPLAHRSTRLLNFKTVHFAP